MNQSEIDIKGKKLQYYLSGNGPSVMLVHGFGEDAGVWRNQVDQVEGYQFIIPNLPGSGSSEMIEDMSMEGMAGVLSALLEQLGIRQVVMIGHSMGGYVALAFAETFDDLLSGLGLFHSTAFADSDEKKATRRKGIEFIRQHGAAAFLKTVTPNLYSTVTKEKNPGLIEDQLRAISYFQPEALIAYYEAMINRPDRTRVLRESQVPVLFIMGREDAATPMADGLKQVYLPTLSYVHILEGSAHMGMQEESGLANLYLLDYLKATQPSKL